MGIGGALLQRLIDFAKDAGLSVLSLNVRSDNTRAIALYQRFGFEKIGTFHDYMIIDGREISSDFMRLRL